MCQHCRTFGFLVKQKFLSFVVSGLCSQLLHGLAINASDSFFAVLSVREQLLKNASCMDDIDLFAKLIRIL